MTAGESVADEHHVLRYVRPSSIAGDGTINGSEFRLRPDRPDDVGVSVSWMECFDPPQANQVSEVRRRTRLTLRRTGCFARLNVGRVRSHVRTAVGSRISVVHDPLPVAGAFVADPAHSLLTGLPTGDSPEAEALGDLIAECIGERFPAVE